LHDTGEALGKEEDLFALAFGDKNGNFHDWDLGVQGSNKWFENDTRTRQGSMEYVKPNHVPNQKSEAWEQ